MKKKILKLSIYGSIFSLFLFLGIYSISIIKEKKITGDNIKMLKNFCALNIVNDNEFCINLLPNKPIILMFMNPECDHCQEEIKQIKRNKDKLKDISILLITSAPIKQVTDFYFVNGLSNLSNLQFLSDENMNITNDFDVHAIPSIFLYNDKRELVYKFNGEIKIEALLKYLK
jgi:thiol-disulfide isomerase/thioredoxin